MANLDIHSRAFDVSTQVLEKISEINIFLFFEDNQVVQICWVQL